MPKIFKTLRGSLSKGHELATRRKIYDFRKAELIKKELMEIILFHKNIEILENGTQLG
jgi:hypothetical protein